MRWTLPKRALLAATVAIFVYPFLYASDDVHDAPQAVILMIGQSNMEGRGDPKDLPNGFPKHPDKIWHLAGDWMRAKEPLRSGVGPGVALADALIDAGLHHSIGLITCTRGALSITEWLPGTHEYVSCMRQLREASGKVVAVVIYQGESDTYSAQAAAAWPRHFATIVAAARAEIGNASLPVVSVVIGRVEREDHRFTYWQALQDLQRNLSMCNVAQIEASAFELKSDGIHLSTTGQLDLGRALADVLRTSKWADC